jgi:hypothetical protein
MVKLQNLLIDIALLPLILVMYLGVAVILLYSRWHPEVLDAGNSVDPEDWQL